MSKSGDIKIKEWNHSGFRSILNSPGVEGIITNHTVAICTRANANVPANSEGFGYKIYTGGRQGRVVGVLFPNDEAAFIAETEEKAASRAIR